MSRRNARNANTKPENFSISESATVWIEINTRTVLEAAQRSLIDG
jgi:hypothetical protein